VTSSGKAASFANSRPEEGDEPKIIVYAARTVMLRFARALDHLVVEDCTELRRFGVLAIILKHGQPSRLSGA